MRFLTCPAAAGCVIAALSTASPAAEMPDPADPAHPVPPVVYQPVLSGYEDPVAATRPGEWRELNERMERIGGPRGQLRAPDEPMRER